MVRLKFPGFKNFGGLKKPIGAGLRTKISEKFGNNRININLNENIRENISAGFNNFKDNVKRPINNIKDRYNNYRNYRNDMYDREEHRTEGLDFTDMILIANDISDIVELTGIGMIAVWIIDFLSFFARGKKYGWFNSLIITILESIPFVGLLPLMSLPALKKIFKNGRHLWHGVRRENSESSHTDRLKIFLKQGAKHSWSFFKVLFLILLLLTGFFWFAQNNLGIIPADLPLKIAMQTKIGIVWFGEFVSEAPKRVGDIWTGFFQKVTDYSTGGYYESRVDKRREDNLNLGVEIVDFKSQRSKFYDDEKVALWFRLRATALMFDENDDPTLDIETWCSYEPNLGTPVESEKTLIRIDMFGDQPVDCELGPLNPGARIIKAHALYNFETNAYLRTYFMDDSRIKMYRLQNKDPLSEYGISERHPLGVYTNGPVKVSIGTNEEYPLRVTDNNEVSTLFGITIENRHKYEGIIRQVTGIELQIPDGLEFDSEHCDFSAAEEEVVYDNKLEENYIKYKVNLNSGRLSERKLRDIDDYLTVNCRLKVKDREKVLGDDGFAVKYLRAKVSYQYEAYKKTTVYVKRAEN